MQELQRIVVKVGTSTLTHSNGRSNTCAMEGYMALYKSVMRRA